MNLIIILAAILIACHSARGDFAKAETRETQFYIDGKVNLNVGGEEIDEYWIQETRIVVDDGRHIGIPK